MGIPRIETSNSFPTHPIMQNKVEYICVQLPILYIAPDNADADEHRKYVVDRVR